MASSILVLASTLVLFIPATGVGFIALAFVAILIRAICRGSMQIVAPSFIKTTTVDKVKSQDRLGLVSILPNIIYGLGGAIGGYIGLNISFSNVVYICLLIAVINLLFSVITYFLESKREALESKTASNHKQASKVNYIETLKELSQSSTHALFVEKILITVMFGSAPFIVNSTFYINFANADFYYTLYLFGITVGMLAALTKQDILKKVLYKKYKKPALAVGLVGYFILLSIFKSFSPLGIVALSSLLGFLHLYIYRINAEKLNTELDVNQVGKVNGLAFQIEISVILVIHFLFPVLALWVPAEMAYILGGGITTLALVALHQRLLGRADQRGAVQ
tara:strand:- start:234227 stop:235237 length:1011 start_codon:yes stop_codon:yes gene_type:complete